MTSHGETVAPHPHAWVHNERHEAVCYLCGALPNTPDGNALCVEPWPENPLLQAGEKIELFSDFIVFKMFAGMIVETNRDPNEYILTLQKLILAEDPGHVAKLELLAGKTQNEAVDYFIERTYWSEDVPGFVGGNGTPAERRAALLAAYRAHQAED